MNQKQKREFADSIYDLLMKSPETHEPMGIWNVGTSKDGTLEIGIGDKAGNEFWILKIETREASEIEVKRLSLNNYSEKSASESDESPDEDQYSSYLERLRLLVTQYCKANGLVPTLDDFKISRLKELHLQLWVQSKPTATVFEIIQHWNDQCPQCPWIIPCNPPDTDTRPDMNPNQTGG